MLLGLGFNRPDQVLYKQSLTVRKGTSGHVLRPFASTQNEVIIRDKQQLNQRIKTKYLSHARESFAYRQVACEEERYIAIS